MFKFLSTPISRVDKLEAQMKVLTESNAALLIKCMQVNHDNIRLQGVTTKTLDELRLVRSSLQIRRRNSESVADNYSLLNDLMLKEDICVIIDKLVEMVPLCKENTSDLPEKLRVLLEKRDRIVELY